jgi:hypothetical protein
MEDNMNTAIKVALTAACVVALFWPLLFWGKSASPNSNTTASTSTQQQLPSNIVWNHDHLW